MQCLDVRQALVDHPNDKAELPAGVRDHLATCESCQAFMNANQALTAVLAADGDETPRPGFDTRFRARLADLRTKSSRPHRLAWGLGTFAASTAALVAFLALRDAQHTGFAEEVDLAVNLELVEDLEVVSQLDDVEAFEVLAAVDAKELEQALEGARRKP
jgi:hypothetical protein